MQRSRWGRRPSAALVVAFVALLASLSGGAYAAGLITSAKIKDGTIRKSDLSPTLLKQLSKPGKRGPAGKPGPPGPPGVAGEGGALIKRTAPASPTVSLLVDMWLSLGSVAFDARADRAYRVTWSNAALETELPNNGLCRVDRRILDNGVVRPAGIADPELFTAGRHELVVQERARDIWQIYACVGIERPGQIGAVVEIPIALQP